MDRFKILNDLIFFRKSIDNLSKELLKLDWDYDGEEVIVLASHVSAILQKFISNELSAKDLEGWANLIEYREDLDYETDKDNELESIIDALANPAIHGKITKQACEVYLDQLSYSNVRPQMNKL